MLAFLRVPGPKDPDAEPRPLGDVLSLSWTERVLPAIFELDAAGDAPIGERRGVSTLITESTLESFQRDGFILIEDLFDPAVDFAPLFGEFSHVLSAIAASLLAQGVVSSSYEELPFAGRLIALSTESGRNFSQAFDISLPQGGIASDTPMFLSDTVFGIITAPKVLDVIEELIGPEIASNPVQHIRMKLPAQALAAEGTRNYLTAGVAWHQDLGVLTEEADAATILSCWMAITDATVENGCLKVLPGSHRKDLVDHCPTTAGIGIPDRLLAFEEATPLPMRAGSVLIFGQNLIHGAIDNSTDDQVRISMDLRYQPPDQPSGRPDFPSFIARSASDPASVLVDPERWRRLWAGTRGRLAERELGKFNRWDADSPGCA
jgi:phytanoyl-CoA hydroxylase